MMAHRISYSITRGAIPPGMVLRHSCDNPQCVNPDHLTPGTHKENMRDIVDRGRHWTKSRVPVAQERTSIRIPDDVYQALVERAARERRTISNLIVALLAEAQSRDQIAHDIAHSPRRSPKDGGNIPQ